MTAGLPDPDWYLDNVLYFAEPGTGGRIQPGPVEQWRMWWQQVASTLLGEQQGLAAPAVAQGFVLSTSQVRGLGVTRGEARGHVRRRTWSVPSPGVIALLDPERFPGLDRWAVERRIHALATSAAVLAHRGQVACGASAAILHGLPTLVVPESPRVTAPPGVTRHHGRVAPLPSSEVTAWFGTAVTSAARTVVDLARSDRRDGLVAADAALHAGLVTAEQLRTALVGARGMPGVRQAAEIVALSSPKPESPLESIVRLALHDDGFPEPELQYPIRTPERSDPYWLDIYWPGRRLAIEADGRVKYTESAVAAGRDPGRDPLWREKQRQQILHRVGVTVERVLWWEALRDWPRRSAELRRAFGD